MSWHQLKHSDALVKIRLGFYSVSFVHLAFIATFLLNVDFTSASDPRLWPYQTLRWKLITLWFNILALIYYPVSIYCDWRILAKKTHSNHVQQLNIMRSICFTSVLFPITLFSDTLFWRIWIKDRELLAPKTVDEVIPFWTQHSMHTVSMICSVIDLLIMPRKKPVRQTLGVSILAAFMGIYLIVCGIDYVRGVNVYPFFELLNGFNSLIFLIYMYVETFFYFTVQWIVVDLLWQERDDVNKKEKKSKQFGPTD